jgi:hypothetical protein
MATSLLPKATIGVKKTTINSAVLRELKPEKSTGSTQSTGIERIGPKDSFIEKLTGIRNFHLKRYESNLFTFAEERKRVQAERIREREEKIEKPSKKRIISIGTPAPVKSIFDSIGNFLLFTAGGILFNRFADLEKSLGAIQKTLEVIGKGIEIVANIVGAFTNFIDSAVKGYDDFLQKIEDVSGFDKKKIEKFMEDFKYVINGAVIAAILTVRALPLFVSRFLRNRLRKPSTPTNTTTSTTRSFRGLDSQRYRSTGQTRAGSSFELEQLRKTRTKFYSATGLRNVSNASMGRFNDSMARYIAGKANPGDMLRLLRRGFFKPFAKFALNSRALKILPFGIGSFIDFLIQYFVFKEPAGRAAFKAIGAGLFGFLGGLIGGPFALFTGAGGAIAGDWAGGKLYDVLFGDQLSPEISGINEYADYDLMTEINNIYIQPVET